MGRFMLHDRAVAASVAAVDVTAVGRVCPRGETSPDCVGNRVLDLWRRNAHHRSGLSPASRQRRIVSPTASALGRMARTRPVSAVVVELAHKKGMIVALRHPPRLRLAGEPLLDPLPDLNVHDP